MKSVINWLSKMLESMANAFMHPLRNDLPPSIVHMHIVVFLLKENSEEG